jgi:hypothetical protein
MESVINDPTAPLEGATAVTSNNGIHRTADEVQRSVPSKLQAVRREIWVDLPPEYPGYRARLWVNFPTRLLEEPGTIMKKNEDGEEEFDREANELAMRKALKAIVLEHNGWPDASKEPDQDGNYPVLPQPEDDRFWEEISNEQVTILMALANRESQALPNLVRSGKTTSKRT